MLAYGLRRSVTRAVLWGCLVAALPGCGGCVEDDPNAEPPRRSTSHRWSQPVPPQNLIPLVPLSMLDSGRHAEEDEEGAALDHD